jgi:TolB protein
MPGCTTDCSNEIYVMRADGTDQQRLTHNELDDYLPVWSPDGQYIAFQRNHIDTSIFGLSSWLNIEIYTIRRDGTDEQRLTNNSGVDA